MMQPLCHQRDRRQGGKPNLIASIELSGELIAPQAVEAGNFCLPLVYQGRTCRFLKSPPWLAWP
ncbi:hypothetical protein EMIT0373P_60415 [Pseudomonas chlororaphis]